MKNILYDIWVWFDVVSVPGFNYANRCILGASVVAQMVKNLPAVQETQVQSLGWEDPPGGGHGNPLQYPCLENSMNIGAWQATVHGAAKSQTQLSD